MATNPYVNKVQKADGTVLIDISDTTATASDVASGKYFYTAAGAKVQGTATGGSVIITDTQDVGGGTIREITATNALTLTTLNATSNQTYTAPSGTAYDEVVVNVSGGGGSIPWFGIGNAELVHTSNYEVALADTNFSSLTPSTTAQNVTMPATAYSSAGTQVTFDEYTPASSIVMSEKSMVIVIDTMTDMKYLTDESTMGIAHVLRCYGSCVYIYGLNVSITSNVASLKTPLGFYTYSSTYEYRTSGNALTGGTGLYGFYNEVFTPAPVLSGGTVSVTKIGYPVSAKIRSYTNIMTSTAWSNVDAENTKLKVRMKTYLVDYPAPKSGVSARVVDMYNNGVFPTD